MLADLERSADRADCDSAVDRLSATRLKYVCVAVTFLGAFLLLQIQPLVGKAILPWFGGSTAVWTTALVLFQLLLTFGYAAVDLSRRFFSPATRSYLFLATAAFALSTLPILPDADWKPAGDASPTWSVLGMLTICIGPAYFLLSLTGPLMQEWCVRSSAGKSPYRLYALSNAGSLLGLLSYPLLFEPFCDLRQQAEWWTVGFVVYCIAASWGAWQVRGYVDLPSSVSASRAESSTVLQEGILWGALAAGGSMMLSATTNYLSQDVPATPLLWVVPLAVYLTSFIVCYGFESRRLRNIAALCLMLLLPAACLPGVPQSALSRLPASLGELLSAVRQWPFAAHFFIVNVMLFFLCVLAHGELAARKPGPQRLTAYYFCISLGGAVGGLFVSIAAPLIYTRYWEWMIGATAAYVLSAAAVLAYGRFRTRASRGAFVGAALAGWAGQIWLLSQQFNPYEIDAARNFYGVVYIDGAADDDGRPLWSAMRHGSTRHGMQITEPGRTRIPTAYYGTESGVGLALLAARDRGRPLRVGVVGLGAGVLAAYGAPGDEYRFYEINPAVARFADEYFSFLRESPARCEVILGDARLSLERETSAEKFDLLVLDAFSGDAVPTHLLTAEAFEIYLRRLRDDGILAVHISNRHLNLTPVLVAAAERIGMHDLTRLSPADPENFVEAARWTLLTRRSDSPWWERIRSLGFESSSRDVRIAPWTDAYSHVLDLLK